MNYWDFYKIERLKKKRPWKQKVYILIKKHT